MSKLKEVKHSGNPSDMEIKHCNKCSKKFTRTEYKILCCGPCGKWYCEHCTLLKRERLKEMLNSNLSWKCPKCLNENRKSIVRDASSDEEDDSVNLVGNEAKFAITDVLNEMRKNHNSQTKAMESFQREVQKSLQLQSDKFEEMKGENQVMKKQLVDQNKELQSAKVRIKTLEEKFDYIEQESREKNIVLMNVPAQKHENNRELVTKIFNGLGVAISDSDYGSARITKKDKAPILMKLTKIELKKDILKKRKEVGCLKMSDCGIAGDSVIYFNEDITHYKQMLYSKARQLKKERKFKYAWVKDGMVYLRKNDEARQILVKTEEDLISLCQV